MDGPAFGSVTDTELHFDSEARKVKAGYWCGLVLFDLFGSKMEPRPSFKKSDFDAPSDISKYSTAWVASKGLKDGKLMTWPPSSPDLNPIEHF